MTCRCWSSTWSGNISSSARRRPSSRSPHMAPLWTSAPHWQRRYGSRWRSASWAGPAELRIGCTSGCGCWPTPSGLDGRLQLSSTGSMTKLLIAANRGTAAVAIRESRRLSLHTVPVERIVRQAVTLLPAHPPGTGASITVPAQVLDAAAARAGKNSEALARALMSNGLGTAEARKIAEVAGGVIRFGHFGAARTRRFEQRQRADHVVSVYDTHRHRYLFTRKPSGGTAWVTLVPGTDAAVTRQLDELLAGLGWQMGSSC